MITAERARYILDNTQKYGGLRYAFRQKFRSGDYPIFADGITEEEDKQIKAYWDTLSGSSTYHDALVRIADGKGWW